MTHLYRTQTAGNRNTFTVSTWIKFCNNYGASGAMILNTDGNNTNTNFIFHLKTNDTISLHLYGGDVFTTSRKLRDYSGWYHIVLGVDTTQASAGDRVKLYINGDLQSITQESLYPAQNFDFGVGNNGTVMSIMGDHDNSNNYDNRSYLSHYHFCDGYQYAASDFGETDSTTGEWKIKTSPSVNYGSTGFFLKFEDSSNLTLDSGGNSISFSTSGTPQASQDNPSNNFSTLLGVYQSNPTGGFSNGNTTAKTGNGDSTWRSAFSSIATPPSGGKYYCEIKWSSGSHFIWGAISSTTLSNNNFKDLTDSYTGEYMGYYGQHWYDNGASQGTGYGVELTSGNIGMMAMDRDNNKFWWGVNGSWGTGHNPATNTGGVSIVGHLNDFWHFAISVYSNSGVGNYDFNFGNGFFGTTAIASEGTNASGIGKFEYDVPSGFTALSTKGLNE